jgi:hypothetical protein
MHVGPPSELGPRCAGFLSRGAQAKAGLDTMRIRGTCTGGGWIARMHHLVAACAREARDEQGTAGQRDARDRRALEPRHFAGDSAPSPGASLAAEPEL